MSSLPTYPSTPSRVTTGLGGGGAGSSGPTYPSSPTKVTSATGGSTPAPATASGEVPFNRQGFIAAYAALTILNWTDPTFIGKLLANPASVLAANGIPTIPGAVIRVIQMSITGMAHIEEQVDYWITGNETGLYDLFMPNLPAGANLQPSGAGGGDACCCCCPCCSCT
jgi:hypothetical protein